MATGRDGGEDRGGGRADGAWTPVYVAVVVTTILVIAGLGAFSAWFSG